MQDFFPAETGTWCSLTFKMGVSLNIYWLIHQVITCHMTLLWFGLLVLTRGFPIFFEKLTGPLFKMIATEVESNDMHCFHPRPKRIRSLSGKHAEERSLDIVGVLDTLKSYEDYDGGVNCKICGKLYKSRVCYIKHIWEHSVYWNMFDGEKNHDRVLSIQAALILYSGNHGNSTEDGETLTDLLVTAPNDKKEDLFHSTSPKKHKVVMPRKSSPLKRKKSFDYEFPMEM